MTEVEFHTGVGDKLGFACRLLRKAAAQGARVVVHGERSDLQRLDVSLWTFEPLAFVPHARWRGGATPEALLRHTAIWLTEQPQDAPHHEVLVNLGPEAAPDAERFARVIELVGADAEDAAAGRLRWKRYAAAGVAIRHHKAA